MKMRFFDFEVFPHYWECVFGDLPDGITKREEVQENIKDAFRTVSSDMPNARDELLREMRESNYVLAGYNIKWYDLQIANAIYQGFTPEQIKIVNDLIIDPELGFSTKEHMRLRPFAKKRISGVVYQDLFDEGTGTLKEKEASLGLSILESNVPFDKEDLTEEDKREIDDYCRHDVYAAMIFYLQVVQPFTKTKLILGKHFNIPEAECRMKTNAQLSARALNAARVSFADAERIDITMPARVSDYVRDVLPNDVIEHLLTKTTEKKCRLFNNDVVIANGGLHSVIASNVYAESDDEWVLMNADGASYYPSVMIQFKTLSRTVRDPQKFVDIFEERVRIKHKEHKDPDDDGIQLADKLILNTTYGASNNKYIDLYDPYQTTRTCRYGQMLLLALGAKLYSRVNGLQVIQTNTDGILIYFRRKDLPLVQKYVKEWEQITGIGMDLEDVLKIWQRDVNNYIEVKLEKGKETVKCKGGWLPYSIVHKGYVQIKPLNVFACGKACIDYYAKGSDPIKTILANKNIEDFVVTCTKGPSYRGSVLVQPDGSTIPLFKCNRVIATKDETQGMVYKYKVIKGQISMAKMPNVPEHCKLVNDALYKYKYEDWRLEIDYMYYIQRIIDMLDVPWVVIENGRLVRTNKFDYNI